MMNEFVREAYIAARESDTGEVSPHYGDDFDTLLRAHNRKIAAEALREAAGDLAQMDHDDMTVIVGDPDDDETWVEVQLAEWLTLRADRIEQGGQG